MLRVDGFQVSKCRLSLALPRGEDFKDEKYLATEIDYAIKQKRKKQNKFSLITLRYPEIVTVPELLETYIYKEVSNDLEGLTAAIKALPIELGSVRWKKEVAG